MCIKRQILVHWSASKNCNSCNELWKYLQLRLLALLSPKNPYETRSSYNTVANVWERSSSFRRSKSIISRSIIFNAARILILQCSKSTNISLQRPQYISLQCNIYFALMWCQTKEVSNTAYILNNVVTRSIISPILQSSMQYQLEKWSSRSFNLHTITIQHSSTWSQQV